MQVGYKSLLLTGAFAFSMLINAHAQLTIAGPACVFPAIEYQYKVSGIQSGSQAMQICITGGVISATDSSCRNGVPVSSIRIIWKDSIQGVIDISGPSGNGSLNVTVAKPLLGGRIDSFVKIQVLDSAAAPSVITCSAAAGGLCSPKYLYRWQQSFDGAAWNDIDGAVSKDLTVVNAVPGVSYYRRRVTEVISSTEAYSDTGIISIRP